MKHMKMSPEEVEDKYGVTEPTPEYEEYFWGLRIHLSQECLDKLDKKVADFSVGDVLEMQCKARVKRVSGSETEEEGVSGEVELQITHMEASNRDSDAEAFREAFSE